MDPGAFCSPGKWLRCSCLSTKETGLIRPGTSTTDPWSRSRFHLSSDPAIGGGWASSNGLHSTIRSRVWNAVRFFHHLWYSSISVALYQAGQPPLPLSISEPWEPTVRRQFMVFPSSNHCRVGRCTPALTGNTLLSLQFQRCSDPVIRPWQFVPCQSRSDFHVWPFLKHPTCHLWKPFIHLPLNISQILISAVVLR